MRTEQAVRNFQTASGLAITGQLDPTTWAALLRLQPKTVDWAKGKAAVVSAALRGGGNRRSGPRSAVLPSVRDEIDGKRH